MPITIKCKNCGTENELSEALKGQIEEQFLNDERSKNQEEVEKVRKEAEEKGVQKAKSDYELQLKSSQDESKEEKERNKLLLQQLTNLTKELRETKRSMEDVKLEAEKQVAADEEKIRQEAKMKSDEEHVLKDKEKEMLIESLKKSLEDAQRKAQQGSMQIQGEAMELSLQEILTNLFRTDDITEVKKGELGGDIRQVVRTQLGNTCGLILWEFKRTKGWKEEWIQKLKEDMRRDGAFIGVIISQVLPKYITKKIGEKNGIWITSSEFIEPLAHLLRKNLYDIAKEKAISSNKQSKAEELYDFATSQEFVQQVERMVEIYISMKEQITKERALSEKQWKQRDMQVNILLTGVTGIYGSIHGIAGPALPEIKSLQIDSRIPHEK